ncbi:MAG: TlpA family protein disulfide reductase [Chitinophagaceae bacterium]
MKIFFLIFCSILILKVEAQSFYSTTKPADYKLYNEILPGERLPNFEFKILDGRVRLTDEFKGKFLLFVFWGVNCASCIRSFNEIEEIQKKFQNDLQIFLITKNDSSAVKKLFLRLPHLQKINIPLVTNDTIFSKYFYYESVPTNVWIDKSGKVIQKTDDSFTTNENVVNLISGKKVSFIRKEELVDFEKGKPLFLEGSGRQIHLFEHYSIIMKQPIGLSGVSDILEEKDSSTGKRIRILKSNVTILELFQYAYYEGNSNNNFLFDLNRINIKVKNPEKLYYPSYSSNLALWKSNNLYSYEVKVANHNASKIYKIMQQDLINYFGIIGEIKYQTIKCIILKPDENYNLKSQTTDTSYFTKEDSQVIGKNIPFTFFLNDFIQSNSNRKLPVINFIDVNQNIDIEINCNFNDWTCLKREFKRVGINIYEEERKIPMFILSQENQKRLR